MRDPVVLVLQLQSVPVHGGVKVTLVGDVDDDLRALLDLEGGAGNRAVVAQHPHGAVAQALGHRPDPQIQGVTAGQFQQLGPASIGEPGRVGGNDSVAGGSDWVWWCMLTLLVVLHPRHRQTRHDLFEDPIRPDSPP